MKKKDSIYLGVILISLIIGHFKHFDLAPRGVHVWRQCNTLAFAKNFYEEDMNILHPRVDHRKHTSGITGSAFPAYEYIVALSYKAFGFHQWNHRVMQFIVFFLGVIGVYLLAQLLVKEPLAAFFAASFYAWSPELYYHGINALPDILAMTSAIWALYLYFKSKSGGPALFFLCFVLLCIAGLVKLQYMLFLLFILIDAIVDKDRIRVLGVLWLGALAGGIVTNWYIYSIKLRYASNLQDYGLFLNPADSFKEGLRILTNNLIMDIPEQILGFGAVLLVLFGIFSFHRKASKPSILKIWAMFTLLFAFHLLELKQMEHHAYYLMPYVILGALSIAYLFSKATSKYTIILFGLALGVQVFHSVNKIHPRYADENSALPKEFLDETLLTQLQTELKDSKLTVVGPDPSGCIYFYYLGVKGWNAAGIEQLRSKDDIRTAIEHGKVDNIVIRGLSEQAIKRYSTSYPKVKTIGEFTVLSRP